jgi:hypothetical protein
MSQLDFYAILDECVSRLGQGKTPKACLADYPSQAGELAPDLALAAELIHLSRLESSPEAVADGYEKMMAALDTKEKISPLASLATFMGKLLSPLWRKQRGLAATMLRTAMIAVSILVAVGSFVVTAAADTLPGDALYPVKRSWENARLTLTVNDSSRQTLQSEFERRRREEVQAVLDLRRPVVVEFTGVVESLVTEVWQVDGLDLTITDDTQVSGAVNVGQGVAVRAQVKDDGSLNALKIVVDNTQPMSRATPTLIPQPTQTPRPPRSEVALTPTPSPTPSPEATRPQPTTYAKPTERPTLDATRTPAPSLDASPSPDGAPTREPQPTNTPSTNSLATSAPRPTETPANIDQTPTPRPEDVAAPSPTATIQPKQDLNPTRTPTATRNTDTWDHNDRPP